MTQTIVAKTQPDIATAIDQSPNPNIFISDTNSKKDAVFILPLGGPKGLFDPGKMQKADEA